MSKLTKLIANVSNKEFRKNGSYRQYGQVVSYNASDRTAVVKVDGYDFTVHVLGSYIPVPGDGVIVVTDNGDKYIEGTYNIQIIERTNENIVQQVKQELYKTFGNHVRSGANQRSLYSYYYSGSNCFIVETGEANIKGSVIVFGQQLTLPFDLNTLAVGKYILIVNDANVLSLEAENYTLLDNQIPLLKIEKVDATTYIYTDIRPTLTKY